MKAIPTNAEIDSERKKKEPLKHNNETHFGSHSLPIDQEHKHR